MEINRLELLFMHFVSIEGSKKLFRILKEKSITDREIINIINKKNNGIKLRQYRDWDYAIEYLSLIYKNNINKSYKNIKYIDICCGNGKKTNLFSKYLGLKKDETYGTDIDQWGPYKQELIKYNFKYKVIKEEKIDYEDNMFDIATCILSLHHIKDLEKFIREIYRIIKPNGYLLLIEHSVYNNYDRLFINIQHLLYTVFYDKRLNYIENPDYIYCYNMYEWNYMMSKNNLNAISYGNLNFEINCENKYDNIFYSYYKKN
jgi:ubiquinone/menaquinone biosynthesis C-methylase UbiE